MGPALDETGLVCLDQGIDHVAALGDEYRGTIRPFSLLRICLKFPQVRVVFVLMEENFIGQRSEREAEKVRPCKFNLEKPPKSRQNPLFPDALPCGSLTCWKSQESGPRLGCCCHGANCLNGKFLGG